MKLYTINTGFFKLDGGAMFGVVPKALWNKLIPADENNLCNWAMRCLLVEIDDRLILIDNGIGTKQDERFFSHYYLNGDDNLEKSLHSHGFRKDDITDVFLTHLHFDHCGGSINYNQSKSIYEPAFKNAIYMERHAARAFVRGIRHKPRANPAPADAAPGGMTDPAWRRGYAVLAGLGLHFELQTPWWHLHEAAQLARDFPDTPIILNHTGLPTDRGGAGISAWRWAMDGLAQCRNVAVKISGLGQAGSPWTVAANGDIVRATIDTFGIDRAMFASNFPVDGLCADFSTILGGFDEITRDLSAAERRALFHDNAVRHYRMTT